ncbi:hypothetical protein BDN70DRAFT_879764 [Pholiota conissans]|uniref:Uncharacterized protein n=1 Tax=Pholiota conissans TaxID=109636 RepID=A0A9P6CZR4_9AGAR|nr:hypothetical protein BDN70DRAFT_879764 [Pholiota conissans]
MTPLALTFLLFAYIPQILAGSQNKGDTCDPGNNRLQAGTYQFWSDCNSVTFCNDTTHVCDLKGCRKDDFPFGYKQDDPDIPDKCPKGQFCPDEGSHCRDLIEVGQPCQFNRDDECAGPPNFKDLADTTGRGLNFNGSLCLNNICTYANKTAGSACTVENTAYTGYGPNGEFLDIVSRGDCMVGLYCDSVSLQCLQSKALGESCAADKECDSWNCLSTGVCGVSAATPHHFGIYVYILVCLGIVGGMAATLSGLYFAHRKQREIERNKRAQYWREQNAFHQNLMNMRETARASILSLPKNGGSRDYSREVSDDSHTPTAPKGSGLRHYLADDGSSELDDGLMYSGKQNDGRF